MAETRVISEDYWTFCQQSAGNMNDSAMLLPLNKLQAKP